MRYEDNARLLSYVTAIQLRVTVSYVSAQIVIAGFVMARPIGPLWAAIGVCVLDGGLTFATLAILWLNFDRRKEAVDSIQNVKKALGFFDVGIYFPNEALEKLPPGFSPLLTLPAPQGTTSPRAEKVSAPDGFFRRTLAPYMAVAVVVVFIGVVMVTFASRQ